MVLLHTNNSYGGISVIIIKSRNTFCCFRIIEKFHESRRIVTFRYQGFRIRYVIHRYYQTTRCNLPRFVATRTHIIYLHSFLMLLTITTTNMMMVSMKKTRRRNNDDDTTITINKSLNSNNNNNSKTFSSSSCHR